MLEPAVCQDIGVSEQARAERQLSEPARSETVLPNDTLPELTPSEIPLTEGTLPEGTLSPRAISQRVPIERALALAESVLSLCEPWRSRFVALIARYIGADIELESLDLEELAGWLVDEDLHERIGVMLRSWTVSR